MRLDDFGSVGDAYQRYSNGIRGKIVTSRCSKSWPASRPPAGRFWIWGAAMARYPRVYPKPVLEFSALTLRLKCCAGHLRKAELPEQVRSRLDFAPGDITDFASEHLFDAVCCHGVLMYLDDSAAAIRKLASHVKRGGLLSILTKNALSGGFRQALRGDYAAARELIETGAAASIGNLGIRTRGDDPSAVVQQMEACGLVDCQWRGVRVFSDHLDEQSFDGALAAELIALERAASLRDPYRAVARLFHATGRKA